MDQPSKFCIQIEALRAVAEWKAAFADEVATQAKELARSSDPPGLITIDHYRQAAKRALQTLEVLIQKSDSSNGHQEAA